MAKPDILRLWGRIIELYSKVVKRGHWEVMHNLTNLYHAGWLGRVEEDTQKALDLYQEIVDLDTPQGFYGTGAVIGNRVGAKNPAAGGLTFLDKAASLGNPPALTELGKLYIYVAKKKDLGLAYTHCVASQGYAPASYESGIYYKVVEHNFPKTLVHYQVSVSQGSKSTALSLSRVFGSETPPASVMWYALNEKLREAHYSIYKKLEASPDLRFFNLIEDYPLPPYPTQGYGADHPDWKSER